MGAIKNNKWKRKLENMYIMLYLSEQHVSLSTFIQTSEQ